LQVFVLAAARAGLVRSAHDCSDGGLAVALAECCLLADEGASGLEADLAGIPVGGRDRAGPTGIRLDALLFGESQSRMVLSCAREAVGPLAELAAGHGVPLARIGTVMGGARLTLRLGGRPVLDEPVDELRALWQTALERHLGN
ncbi:MAG: hypothetical protein K6U08_08490, partial [Firmicutes bacterium]|nr:hypothetical protein [Bacillota bacterium]